MYYFNDFDRQQDEEQWGMEQMRMGQIGMRDGMGMGMLSSDLFLINDISEAVIREVQAYNFYQRLAELAPNNEYRQTILGIQNDEARHYHWFTMMLLLFIRILHIEQPLVMSRCISCMPLMMNNVMLLCFSIF